jgi:hypothetical protein
MCRPRRQGRLPPRLRPASLVGTSGASAAAGARDRSHAIAPLANSHRGRIEDPAFVTDYAIDYFDDERQFFRRLTLVEHSPELPYIAITELRIQGDDQATTFIRAIVTLALIGGTTS